MAARYFISLCITVSGMLSAITGLAQHNILHGDTLILSNHEKFWLNEEVIFGTGTMPDRAYSYIYEAPNSLQKLIKDRNRKLLSPAYKGYKSKIVKFEKEIGHNKKDYDYTILVLEMPDGKKYWCDIASAFSNHEIVLRASENNGGGATITKSEPAKDDANNLTKKKSTNSKKPTSKKTKPKPVPVF